MCGIFAFLGNKFDINNLYSGLSALQNRGYDSAGMSSIIDGNFIVDKYASTNTSLALDLLKPYLYKHKLTNNFISHVRYSCVGISSDQNSHPHVDYTNKFSLIHNGIIENYDDLKKELLKLETQNKREEKIVFKSETQNKREEKIVFKSETDTEVIVNYIGYYYSKGYSVNEAINKTLGKLKGTWSLVIQCIDQPDKLFCCCKGSPLLLGVNNDYAMVTSEQSGFSYYIKEYITLKDNDVITLSKQENKIIISSKSSENKIQDYELRNVKSSNYELTPEPYSHWTLKEIYEQPESSLRTMGMGSKLENDEKVRLKEFNVKYRELLEIKNLIILGCGTSYNAGLYSSYTLKLISGFNTVQIFDGAEFDISDVPKEGKTGLILLSQSGETKDLHRCLKIAKNNKLMTIGVINVIDSTIAKEVDCVVYLNSGREMGVASTKCFTSQIVCLNIISCWFSQYRNINKLERMSIIKNLKTLPKDIMNVIDDTLEQCIQASKYLINYESSFLLGKRENQAIAMEGSLKIKEIGYININGYSTSSLKHGSYALIQEGYPVILLLPDDSFFQRNNSVGEELKSRGAYVITISDKNDTSGYMNTKYDLNIKISNNEVFYGVLANISLQLIAYHVALLKGNKIDTPRNLCKSVTVD